MSETICRAILKGRLFSNVETRNMYEWHSTDGGTPSSFTLGILDHLEAMYSTIYNQIAGAVWESYSVETQHWDGESWVTDYETPFELEPTGIGSTPQYQTAVLLTMTTNHKRTVGRKFIPGYLDAIVDEGGLASSALTAFANFILTWLGVWGDETGYHWYPGVLAKNGTFYAFNGGTIGQILSTMRRRKPGYGI